MGPYRFGIIGCSRIAQSHIEAIHQSPRMHLAAVADILPGKARAYGEQYGCPAYADHREMLEREDLHIVNICAPSGFHASLAMEAARTGRHVLVEKPMCLNLEQADALLAACREAGVKLGVVHQLRFTPVVRQLKDAITRGKLGKLSHGSVIVRWNRSDAYFAEAPWRGTRALDGGALLNQALHYIDLLLWLFGPVEAVSGYRATRLRRIETEDVSVAALRFKNGALGSLEAAITLYPENLEESLNIFAERATIVLDGKYAHNIVKLASAEDLGLAPACDPPPWLGHQQVMEDMLQAIEEGREPLVHGREARKVLELIFAIYESSEKGSQVVLS